MEMKFSDNWDGTLQEVPYSPPYDVLLGAGAYNQIINMIFKDKAKEALQKRQISYSRIEGEDSDLSLVFHILEVTLPKIEGVKKEIEKKLNAMVEILNMFGMHIAIIESNDLEE